MTIMPPPNPLKLPARLVEELGGIETSSRRGRSQPRLGRKELRKADRAHKKALRDGRPPQKRVKTSHQAQQILKQGQPNDELPLQSKSVRQASEAVPRKSILKATKRAEPATLTKASASFVSKTTRIAKSVHNKLAEDDEEITALEKKLGLKGKKGLPKSFKEDGLDDLLDGLYEGRDEEDKQSGKGKAEGDEWLRSKRRQAREAQSSSEDDSREGSLEKLLNDDDSGLPEDASDYDIDGLSVSKADSFREMDSDEEDIERSAPTVRVRENPYIAPISNSNNPSEKYIPPSLRAIASGSDTLVRLRRQTQGLINRLTEANLISILGDVEKLYRENPRQHVTSALMDLLLLSVCEPTSLPDTLIILPAGFIAAIYKIIGTDFGAQLIQGIVESFDGHYIRAVAASSKSPASVTSESSKETSNLIMLISELYNFQVIGSALIFDYIRLFLSELSELNAELLLKIIRTSGPQLRQDDPSSLKDIVALLRPAVAWLGKQNLSVRTKFMIETIDDLKNGKLKTGAVASGITSEHTIRMKKTLGSLNTRSIKASEPLRIGLKDIRNSDKKGKWWLVGASWGGNSEKEASDSIQDELPRKRSMPSEDAGVSDLGQLAREQRMNTDIRRAIFVAIMSASDYQDAYLRLTKLKLKKVQEFEIPKVLIRCAGAEKTYNPYYTLIAKKICGDRRLRTSFQYGLWDLFKKMGESEEDEYEAEEEEETLDTRYLVKLAKMFGVLIAENALCITVLKNLNMTYLQPKTKTFMEVMMITILLHCKKQSAGGKADLEVANIFVKAKDTPQLVGSLIYFLKKVVCKTDIAGETEKTLVRSGCKAAVGSLEALTVSAAAGT